MRYHHLPDHVRGSFDALCAHEAFTVDDLLRAYIRRLLCDAFSAGHALASSMADRWLVLPSDPHQQPRLAG